MGKDVKRVGRNAIIIAVLCVVFIIGLYGTLIFGPKIIIHILSDDSASERQIKSFVQKHEEEILSCIEQGDYSALDQYDIIKKLIRMDQVLIFIVVVRDLHLKLTIAVFITLQVIICGRFGVHILENWCPMKMVTLYKRMRVITTIM